ncbi:MAG: hypothetical protein P4L46_20540 [Fimbriimonas sp.]|nr:hypothetical protein [Fimbriimonas sp.]
MKFTLRNPTTLIACLAMTALAVPSIATRHSSVARVIKQTDSQGMVVAYPWAFQNGDKTSRQTAISTAEEIGRKAGFASVPKGVAKSTWASSSFPVRRFGRLPSKATLEAFGRSVHASKVIYGSVTWHTRSIWVSLGPKTISTATVDAYVFDVASNKVVFRNLGVTGRSDEREDIYKVAADILITPLVSAVSGGPATPREQRAVQIALGTAYHHWVRHNVSMR